jgi:dihydroorotase
MYDTLIRGGRVIDPLHGLDALLDVAIQGERIAAVGPGLPPEGARQVLDATGLLVAPGLIDLHVHVHWGVSHYGIEADQCCLARGVTTAVEAGSAGAYTYPSLKRWIMDASQTEVYALLNIAYLGMIGDQVGELEDARFIDEALAEGVAQAPEILGLKARMDRVGPLPATEPLARALAVAGRVHKPLMVHIGSARRMGVPLEAVLAQLRPGDVVTHCYHGKDGNILDEKGAVRPAVWRARERGMLLDVAHGAGSFTWGTARRALEQGLFPDTISSDLHTYSLLSPVVDLATTMTKFLHLGMPLPDVIRAATAAPAAWMGMADRDGHCRGPIGHLGQGAAADVALLRLETGAFDLYDCDGAVETATQRLAPVTALKRGRLFGLGPASALGLLTL